MLPRIVGSFLLSVAAALAQDAGQFRIYYGDLHTHTTYSPDASIHFGARHYEDPGWACLQARRNGLDFLAVTDHDFALGPRKWTQTQLQVNRNNQPGVFTTFLGYEWTSMTSTITYGTRDVTFREGSGHRCVIFKDDEVPSEIYRCIDPRYDTPKELWAKLRDWLKDHPEADVLTIPHSPMSDEEVAYSTRAGDFYLRGDQTVDWNDVDTQFQTLVEVFSKHGNSEGSDGLERTDPRRFEATYAALKSGNHAQVQRALRTWYLPVESFDTYAEHSVQTALNRWLDPEEDSPEGYKLGIVASTDDHTVKPGSVQEDGEEITWPCHGGLVAVHARENTREGIWEALRARRVYGTSGARIELWFEVEAGGVRQPMGGTIACAGSPRLVMRAKGENGQRIERFDVIKNGVPYRQLRPRRALGEWRAELVDEAFDADAYYYVRAVQEETLTWYRADMELEETPMEPFRLGERAWSSPVWVEKAE